MKWGHEARARRSRPVRVGLRLLRGGHALRGRRHDRRRRDAHARARLYRRPDGRFIDARFELDDPDVRKLFEEHSWAWDDNPFVGTRELTGLKIVVMLLSNWDTKDRRDVARGSNTAIFEHRASALRAGEARYLITDWGGAMGSGGRTS